MEGEHAAEYWTPQRRRDARPFPLDRELPLTDQDEDRDDQTTQGGDAGDAAGEPER
ncbi:MULTISPECIES: hypothetical protein [unclassified Brachybacterium]|uniref:hypothetical protein n=1 Tax=unclassified Brachybacterium TaxID=2623841 RepID=UPI00360BCB03